MGCAEYDVVLLPTFIQVETWRKKQACQGSGVFGQTATTFAAWIADLWELYGDGRALVDSVGRQMLMRIAFSQMAKVSEGPDDAQDLPGGAGAGQVAGQGDAGAGQDDGPDGAGQAAEQGDAASLTLSPGLAPLAARCEQQAAGVVAYDRAVALAGEGHVPAGLSKREGVLLQGIARYRSLLADLGLVEPGAASAWLAQRSSEVFPRPLRVVMKEAAPLDWRTATFFEACPALELIVEPAPGAQGVGRAPSGVKARLAYPAGRYATAGLVADLLQGLDEGEQAVVTSPDPLALGKELEPALARKGMSVAVQALVRFGQTDAGRAILLAMRLVFDKTADAAVVADLAWSPFSGFSRDEANEIDVALRLNRIADIAACTQDLCERSGSFARLLDVAGADNWAPALSSLEGMVREMPHRSLAWRSEQLAALAGLRAVRGISAKLGAKWLDTYTVLDQLVVSTPYRSALMDDFERKPQVLVTTQGAAAQLGRASCALLIACDLSADSYPIADKDDAATTLFGKLGLQPVDDALSRARRTFAALAQVASREFLCLRPLNDADGKEAYACAMLEEFIDSYRSAPEGDSADDDRSHVPAELAEGIAERGEELLYANARATDPTERQPIAAIAPEPQAGDVGEPLPDAMLVPRRAGQDGQPVRRSPSPSQIEVYLECPYKWFVQRRLGIQAPEEGFGPLERGTFSHAVLERFYRRFAKEGHAKVNAENLDVARAMLAEEADALEAEMRLAEPGSQRLVAASHLEEREIGQLKEQLVAYLDFEKELLPGFHPQYLEYEFSQDGAIPYAGCSLVGKVDRIDVDDAGHAVVIDYKSSVGPEHDIEGKDQAHPGKIQTRIYAQMVKRALGLDVVGALYVSCGKRHGLAGAADARILEAAHLPESKDGLWCSLGGPAAQEGEAAAPDAGEGGLKAPARDFSTYSFAEMLDATEDVVARAIERMERGIVAPAPSSPAACDYCPVADCPKKGA